MEIPIANIIKVGAVVGLVAGGFAWVNSHYLQMSIFNNYKATFESIYNADRIENAINLVDFRMDIYEMRIEDGKQLTVKQASKYKRLQAALIDLEAAKDAALKIY